MDEQSYAERWLGWGAGSKLLDRQGRQVGTVCEKAVELLSEADAEIAALKAENERLRAWIKASYKDLPISAWGEARALLGVGVVGTLA